MATRPANFLNWLGGLASPPAQYQQQPTPGQLTTGWVAGEPPPFQYENYALWLLDQWTQYLDSTVGQDYPQFFAEDEATFAQALSDAQGAGGGVICLTASFTITTTYTLPDNTVLIGRRGTTVVTFDTGSSLTLGDECKVLDVYFTTLLTTGNLMIVSGQASTVEGSRFAATGSGVVNCVYVSGDGNRVLNCVFDGCSGAIGETDVGIYYAAGGAENLDRDCVFLT